MRRLLAPVLAAAFAGLIASASPALAQSEAGRVSVAPAQSDVDHAAAALANGPGVYLAPSADGHPLNSSDVSTIDSAVKQASTPIYVAVLGEPSRAQANADLRQLIDRVHQRGTYVVVGTGGFVASSDVPGVSGSTESLVQQAIAAHRGDATSELVEFVNLVDAAASGGGAGGAGGAGNSSSSSGVPGWIPAVAVLVLLGALFLFVRRRRVAEDRQQAAAFAEVRAAAEQDVTKLGEELTALDVPPAGASEATADYQAALDAYERAKSDLAASRRPADLAEVTSALEEGRWRLACVRARLAGQPLPDRRPPCFFNPQHGPSVTDVQWAPPSGAPRTVPVCAADADRLARGHDPDARLISTGGRLVPYWSGPAYFGPYAGGFFGGWGGGSFLGGLLLGEMLAGPGFGGWGAYGAYGAGYGGGFDGGASYGDGGDFAGGFDTGGGGWDAGGDWGGGGDFGGGDFGGGDWGGGGGDGGGW